MATKRKRPEPPTGIRFDTGTREWLAKYSKQEDLTVSQLVRRAVAEYRVRVLTVTAEAVRKAGG